MSMIRYLMNLFVLFDYTTQLKLFGVNLIHIIFAENIWSEAFR
jgi:hypothetical protein